MMYYYAEPQLEPEDSYCPMCGIETDHGLCRECENKIERQIDLDIDREIERRSGIL